MIIAKIRLHVVCKYVLIFLNWRRYLLESVCLSVPLFRDWFLQSSLFTLIWTSYALSGICPLQFAWKPLEQFSSCCLFYGSFLLCSLLDREGGGDMFPPKLLLTLTGPYDLISQKVEPFIATGLRTWNLDFDYSFSLINRLKRVNDWHPTWALAILWRYAPSLSCYACAPTGGLASCCDLLYTGKGPLVSID
jgi:hypothetical protein